MEGFVYLCVLFTTEAPASLKKINCIVLAIHRRECKHMKAHTFWEEPHGSLATRRQRQLPKGLVGWVRPGPQRPHLDCPPVQPSGPSVEDGLLGWADTTAQSALLSHTPANT